MRKDQRGEIHQIDAKFEKKMCQIFSKILPKFVVNLAIFLQKTFIISSFTSQLAKNWVIHLEFRDFRHFKTEFQVSAVSLKTSKF